MRVALRPVIHFNVDKTNNKSQLTSTGVSLISKSLFADTDFSGLVAKVAGNSKESKEEILQEDLRAGTNMIDHILEQKNDDPGQDLLHKAIESSDPKYNDVTIAIDYPAPTEEGPVFKTFSLKLISDLILSDNGKTAVIIRVWRKPYL